MAYRHEFNIIMMYWFAATKRLVTMLQQCGLGNGPYRLYRTMEESCRERYMQLRLLYLEDCRL